MRLASFPKMKRFNIKKWHPKNLSSKGRFATFIAIFVILGGGYLLFVSRAAPPKGPDPLSTKKEVAYASDHILVKLKKPTVAKLKDKQHPNPADTGDADLDKVTKGAKATKLEPVAKAAPNSDTNAAVFSWYKVTTPKPNPKKDKVVVGNQDDVKDLATLQFAADTLKKNPAVEDASLSPIFTLNAVPNDPLYTSTGAWGQTYPDMWDLRKINAEAAWNSTTGSSSMVVADIDTGLDYNHPDIVANLWTNPNANNDGFTNDLHGCGFINMTGTNTCGDTMDDSGHGSHTAGTIGAVGNNGVGITGINWNVKIMPLKVFGSNGGATTEDIINALVYAADHGAKVSNNSYGAGVGFGYEPAFADAVKYEHDHGMVTVVSAGNETSDTMTDTPADLKEAITISATDHNDGLACYSNFGNKIDVGAPGGTNVTPGCSATEQDYILSLKSSQANICSGGTYYTVYTNYCVLRGTSMAAPHVTGEAALILAKNPSLTNEQVRQIIRKSADDTGDPGKDGKFGYGRINLGNAIAMASSPPLAPFLTTPDNKSTLAGSTDVYGSIAGPNFASYKVEISSEKTENWTSLSTGTTQPTANTKLATVNPLQYPDDRYQVRLTATDTAGKTYEFTNHLLLVHNFNSSISFPHSDLVSQGNVTVTGSATTLNGLSFNKYTLEWGQGYNPTSWSSSGITLPSGGTQPVANGTLGTWNTSVLSDNQVYSLRLTTYGGVNGSFSSAKIANVSIDKDLLPGFPKPWSVGACTDYTPCQWNPPSPVMADIDGDGKKEVVMASSDQQLDVYRKDGSELPGFPLTIPGYDCSGQPCPGTFMMTPRVADLNGDGKQEIVVSAFATFGPGSFGYAGRDIYVIQYNGTIMSGWPKHLPYSSGALGADSVTLADLNGDGLPEILTYANQRATTAPQLNAFTANGSELPGFPNSYVTPSGLQGELGNISAANIGGGMVLAVNDFQKMHLLDSTGHELPGWPVTTPATPDHPTSDHNPFQDPEFGDIDGDGNLEVVALGNGSVNAYHKDGSQLTGYPILFDGIGCQYNVGDHSCSISAQGDINNDGKDEIVDGFGRGSSAGLVTFGQSGVINNAETDTCNGIAGHIVLGDVDGNGKLDEFYRGGFRSGLDVLDPGGGAFHNYCAGTFKLRKDDGTTLWDKHLVVNTNDFYDNKSYLSSPVMADLDGNGRMEIAAVAQTWYSATPLFPGSLYLWEFSSSKGGGTNNEWPQGNHDAATTGRSTFKGVSDNIPPTVTLTSPTNGSTIEGTAVSLTANASDNVGIAKVEFSVDNTVVNADTTAPYSFNWNSELVSNGTHTVMAKAYDTSGNVALSSASVTVNNTGDHTPPNTPSSVSVGAGSPFVGNVSLTCAFTTDNVGVVGDYFVRDGVTIGVNTAPNFTGSFIDTHALPNTTYSYQCMAFDAAGNVSALSPPTTFTTPDGDGNPPPPDASAPSAPSNLTGTLSGATQVNLSWTASTDNVGVDHYDVWRNNAKVTTVAGTTTSYGDTNLNGGSNYSYYVYAYDKAGNKSAKSNQITVTTIKVTATTGAINGKVTDINGAVLKDPTGRAVSAKVYYVIGTSTKSIQTTSTGTYIITSLPPNSYNLNYIATGYNSDTTNGVQVTANSLTTQPDKQLHRLGSIASTVKDAVTGNNITNATVSTPATINGHLTTLKATFNHTTNQYVLANLPAGQYTVTYQLNGYITQTKTVTVSNDTVTPQDVTLSK